VAEAARPGTAVEAQNTGEFVEVGPEDDSPEEYFAQGEVIAVAGDGFVLKALHSLRAVRVTDDAVVWKEFDVDRTAIQMGDWVDVRGTTLADGTLLAQSGAIWVNIGRRDGTVINVDGRKLVIETRRGSEIIETSDGLEVLDISAGERILPDGVAALTPGMFIGAVGVRIPNGGFRATRIWSSEFGSAEVG
jgi:hypothetical protein